MSAHAEAIRASLPRAPIYAYWHLLSLDAPTVAVVWCCAFAASAGVRPPLYAPVALAIATWMLYVADRLLDVRHARATEQLRDRHWFHGRHATALLAGLAIAALALGWIVARDLSRGVLRHELLLGAAVVIYFAAIHFPIRRFAALHRIPSKEAIVGVIFALAVAIPAWTLAMDSTGLFAAVVGFAALCGLNCLVIETMEHSSAKRSQLPAGSEKLLLILAAGALALVAFRWRSAQNLLLLSISISSLLLFALCRLRHRISSLAFRIAADAALLTPILFAPWLWMRR
jgi:hypothetical protein